MKTILIPVDFSEGSLISCKYAIHLAGNKSTKIFLLHVYPDQIIIPDSSFPAGINSESLLSNELIIELRKQSVKNMLEFSKMVKTYLDENKLKHIELKYEVTGGDPQWEVYNAANKLDSELIVMGTRGEGKKGFLEGSMAENIMNKLNIPVLAVPESVDSLIFHNVMYATNYSEKDYQNIKKLLELFQNPQSTIHVIHFELKGKAHENESMMKTLQTAIHAEFPNRNVKFHTMDTDKKSTALELFTNEFEINIIAFLVEKSNIFKNLFSNEIHKKDFFKLEIPMLALHD